MDLLLRSVCMALTVLAAGAAFMVLVTALEEYGLTQVALYALGFAALVAFCAFVQVAWEFTRSQ